MNRTHRSLWNSALGAWVAAPENARARGKRGGTASCIAKACALTAAMWCAGLPAAHACLAGNTDELVACIAGNDTVIDLTASITLTRNLPVLSRDVTINGGQNLDQRFTLDGDGKYRGFFIGAGTTTVNNLTMQNLRAQGGKGGTDFVPGGGGMGAGGAVFVMTGAGADLNNVDIIGSSAVGGDGGAPLDDSVNNGGGVGGGGGMGGNGGGSIPGAVNVARGGGGLFDDGGVGSGVRDIRYAFGGIGGGPAGGAGGDQSSGGDGGLYSGGGGAASAVDEALRRGGTGGFGGGGGGGARYGTGSASQAGGAGGFGGGGGGGVRAAGAGGFGGGGGGGSANGSSLLEGSAEATADLETKGTDSHS